MSPNREPTDPFGIIGGIAESHEARQDTPEEEEQLLIDDLKQRIEEFKQVQKTWLNNVEYLRIMHKGDQLVVRRRSDRTILRIVSSESEDVRRRHSRDNVLHVAARAFVGKFCRVIPSVAVIPASEDRHALSAAEVRESFLDYIWRKERMRLKWKRAGDMLPDRGTAILQPVWDTSKGPKVSYCETCFYTGKEDEISAPCPVCNAQFQMRAMDESVQAQSQAIQAGEQPPPSKEPPEPPKLVEAREGDLCCILHDSRDFLFDTSAVEIEEMQWCGVQSVCHVAKLRKRFPDKWHLITPEEGLYNDRYLYFSGSVDSAVLRTAWLKEHVRLFEIHEMPTGEYPLGRIIFMANNRILEVRDNVYVDLLGRLPFYAVRSDRRADEFLGEPLGLQAEDIQKERNKLGDQTREHRELTNNPKVLSSYNSGVNVDLFTTTPGEHIKYNALSPKPEYLRPPDLPTYVWNEFERLKGAIREKYGVTEHDLGTSSGEQSGRFAAFLETQSGEAISPIMIECYEEWVELHRAFLIIGKHFMPENRIWAIQGHDRIKTFSWSQVDDRYGWDVALATEDSLSKSPAIRLQQALELWNNNVFVDQSTGRPNTKQFLKVAGLKMPGNGPNIEGTEHAYAAELPKLIEKAIEKGLPPPPIMPFDDAKIMVEELLGWLLANRNSASPQVLQAVMAYWYQYSMVLNPADPANAGLMPNPGLAQMYQQNQARASSQAQQPQGGGPGAQAEPNKQPSLQPEQNALVQNADRTAENMARQSMKHEG